MPEALARVKQELGPEAVILGTRTLPAGTIRGLVGKTAVEITAALPTGESPAPRVTRKVNTTVPAAVAPPIPASVPRIAPSPPAANTPAISDQLLPYYTRLVQSEFGEQLAAKLVQNAAMLGGAGDPRRTREIIGKLIASMIPVAGGIELVGGRRRSVALIGPPGAGKTTTLAKLAAQFRLRMRKRVAIVSLDMHRLANHEQIRRYGELIGVPVFVANTPTKVRDVFRTLPDVDLVLIDSHGVSPRERGRFARLAAMLRAAKPDETHLVLPASMAPAVQAQICDAAAALNVSKVMLTRMDEVLGLGVVLSAVQKIKWGISYVTDGQNVPSNVEIACGTRFAERILPALG